MTKSVSIRAEKDKQAAKSAIVSMADLAVIRRCFSGCSNTPTSASELSSPGSVRGFLPILLTNRRDTGPPISPPNTKPKVAAAIPKAVAPSILYFCSNTFPHAPAVPCPPVRVIEPVISPIIGLSPKAVAKLTPTRFCITMKRATTPKKINKPTPPDFRREKSALSPMEEKKISIKVSCRLLSKSKESPCPIWIPFSKESPVPIYSI